MIGLLKRLSGFKLIFYFFSAYPWQSAIMVCCFLFSGVADGVSVLTLLPLIEFGTSGSLAGNSVAGRLFQDLMALFGLEPRLSVMLGVIVICVFVKAALFLIAMKQAGYTVANVTTDLRITLIRSLLGARWNYFVSKPAGYFANAIGTEALRAGTAYHHAALFVASLIQVIIYGVVAMIISWKITLSALIVAFVLLFGLKGLIQMGRNAGNRQTELMKSIITGLTDMLQGIKPIKAMAREGHIQPLLERETRDLKHAVKHQILASEMLKALQEPIVVVIVAAGVFAIITYGHQQFASLLVMVYLFNRLLNRFYNAQLCYQEVVTLESALWSILENINTAKDRREIESDREGPASFTREIAMESVEFSHDDRPLLRNLSLVIPRGMFVSIIGPSGVGKTTVVDLIIGLFRPGSGKITVDGYALDEMDLRAWRGMIGYVPQEMFLFHDTIFNNITLGGEGITREDVADALRSAGAWDFVSQMPGGIDATVGERGAMLSGGQRQRISIARALVHRPKLLILDEATTALDPQTEAEICGTLRGLLDRLTIVAISHQQEIMKVSDIVYRINDGMAEEVRPHERNVSSGL